MTLKVSLGLGLLGALLATSIGLATVYAETTGRSVDAVGYNATMGELTLTSHDGAALETRNVVHHPWRKELVFEISGATVAPGFKEYKIDNDPVIKSVTLTPMMEKGKPVDATRVKIHLWTNAPFLPFMMVPSQPGLKLVFTRASENTPVIAKAAGAAAAADDSIMPRISESNPAKPVQPMTNPTGSVLGPVSGDTFSVIQDVFYDENVLTVVSKAHPIEVKRSFVLTEPNRYIVDLSPAVLESKSLTRAILQSNPDIVSMKTGQFDENTVRIVVQFMDKVKPVDLSQWENNKVLKLNF